MVGLSKKIFRFQNFTFPSFPSCHLIGSIFFPFTLNGKWNFPQILVDFLFHLWSVICRRRNSPVAFPGRYPKTTNSKNKSQTKTLNYPTAKTHMHIYPKNPLLSQPIPDSRWKIYFAASVVVCVLFSVFEPKPFFFPFDLVLSPKLSRFETAAGEKCPSVPRRRMHFYFLGAVFQILSLSLSRAASLYFENRQIKWKIGQNYK